MIFAHRMAAAVAICLPLVARLGGGSLGFSMYASSTWFRVDVSRVDEAGQARPIAPTALAARVGPTASPFLAGSDHFRRANDVSALRSRLTDVARVGCLEDRDARTVTMTLLERAGAVDGPERTTTTTVSCPR